MTGSASETREALIRALIGLPSLEEYETVLRSGRLPIDERSRKILENRFPGIKAGYAWWDTNRNQPAWADAFARIEKALNNLVQEFQTEAGQQALAIIEEGAILSPLKKMPRRCKKLVELRDRAKTYREIYSARTPRRTASENWLFEQFYKLYGEISGARPGNAGPLYRFTMAGAKLLGIKLNITESTFRMRLERYLKKQIKTDLTDPAFRMRIQRALNAHHDRSKAARPLM